MPDLFLTLEEPSGDSEETTTPQPLDEPIALEILRTAEITASKLIPWGSNYTFAVAMEAPETPDQLAIYKPQAGETPLWDFPDGTLYKREHASYLLSRYLGWDIVPPTVIRDGPSGIGSVQLYIEPKPNRSDDYEFWGRPVLEIERLVVFDLITNNADRKLTHCLVDTRDKVWGIDHGLTFNIDPKLRTVLWQFTGKAIAPSVLRDLRYLLNTRSEVVTLLEQDLFPEEIEIFLGRVQRLADAGQHPVLDPARNVPYGWW